eukprot:7241591-Pyramimonas_sp.AAC.1
MRHLGFPQRRQKHYLCGRDASYFKTELPARAPDAIRLKGSKLHELAINNIEPEPNIGQHFQEPPGSLQSQVHYRDAHRWYPSRASCGPS